MDGIKPLLFSPFTQNHLLFSPPTYILQEKTKRQWKGALQMIYKTLALLTDLWLFNNAQLVYQKKQKSRINY
jgi:hypothetical protein